MSCISLTTDFGVDDWFVGTMKGVIHGKSPTANIIDLTHGIPHGDIRAGAFALMAGYPHFPKQSVHVAVIDPGVGSDRPAIAVDTADYFFVGPDNGVLSWALRNEDVRAIHRLENAAYFLENFSATFHGRDFFAPVAAELMNGVSISHLGEKVTEIERLPWPSVHTSAEMLSGEIIYIDVFGNGITNIPVTEMRELRAPSVRIGSRGFAAVEACYGAVKTGHPVAVRGSSGYLELAVNGGNAAEYHHLEVGTNVSVR